MLVFVGAVYRSKPFIAERKRRTRGRKGRGGEAEDFVCSGAWGLWGSMAHASRSRRVEGSSHLRQGNHAAARGAEFSGCLRSSVGEAGGQNAESTAGNTRCCAAGGVWGGRLLARLLRYQFTGRISHPTRQQADVRVTGRELWMELKCESKLRIFGQCHARPRRRYAGHVERPIRNAEIATQPPGHGGWDARRHPT